MNEISLNGIWKCIPDPNDEGIENKWFNSLEYERLKSYLIDIEIPNSFNILEGFKIYEGIFWHFYTFDIETFNPTNKKLFRIIFEGSNYNTKVWINGSYLGEHDGGFVPFHFNFYYKLLKKCNLLVVRVDNLRKKERIPAISFDWLNWGGIYRDIKLVALDKNRIKDVVIKTRLGSRKISHIKVELEIIGKLSIRWEILESDKRKIMTKGSISKSSGKTGFSFTKLNPHLWSPDNPFLYLLNIYDNDTDNLLYNTFFGIREIEVRGKSIYLNKKRLFMKGVSLHEELMPYGRNIPYEEREWDIENMKSIGFNALRTAHYSHDEDLLNIADKKGMLLLEEIPVYWACDFRNNETFRTAAKMMRELIKRDINHPSLIWWSAGNEIPIERPEVAKFMRRLMDWIRMHDDTRIVTYVSMKIFCDLTRKYADVATINFYFGWYVGSSKMISLMLDVMRTPHFNKPWIYTEFGAGAKYGFHADWQDQIKFSEERQLHILDYSIRTFNSKDYISGWFIWIYRDFRSFLRQNQYQEGFNRKGIVSEKNEKKLIAYRIPQILNKGRNLKNTKILGIFLWIIFYPFAYILTYLILDAGIIFGNKKTIEEGKLKDKERISKGYKN